MGDIHFSQGDGEISFCGAIEMSGYLDLHVDIIKGGMAKYGMVNPIFKPSPVEPHYSEYLVFEGISVDEFTGEQYYLDAHVAYRQRLPQRHQLPEEVRLHRRAGLPVAQLRPGRRPAQRHRRHPQRLLHAGVAHRRSSTRRSCPSDHRHLGGRHATLRVRLCRLWCLRQVAADGRILGAGALRDLRRTRDPGVVGKQPGAQPGTGPGQRRAAAGEAQQRSTAAARRQAARPCA